MCCIFHRTGTGTTTSLTTTKTKEEELAAQAPTTTANANTTNSNTTAAANTAATVAQVAAKATAAAAATAVAIVVALSPEARAVLGIEAPTVAPLDLLRAILTAPVDLLYNGGIGTYVKAAAESNADVGDRANDSLRVNANQVRANETFPALAST